MTYRWDPWYGCHKYSEGCQYCYIHKGAAKRGINADVIVKGNKFYAPIEKKKNGEYKMQSGLVWLCFATDFLLEDADEWRKDCFQMIKERPDLHFHFLTKRIDRFLECIPADWGDGYPNVTVGCTVENQKNCDYKLSIFDTLPIIHKQIVCQPLLEEVNISKHLKGVEYVVVGGESDKNARVFDLAWAKSLQKQCMEAKVSFDYRQCGSNYRKDGMVYRLNPFQLTAEARKENLSFFV